MKYKYYIYYLIDSGSVCIFENKQLLQEWVRDSNKDISKDIGLDISDTLLKACLEDDEEAWELLDKYNITGTEERIDEVVVDKKLNPNKIHFIWCEAEPYLFSTENDIKSYFNLNDITFKAIKRSINGTDNIDDWDVLVDETITIIPNCKLLTQERLMEMLL